MADAINVGIDASRNRSGGAMAHLVGILSDGNPLASGVREVHVWAPRQLADRLPQRSWLHVHTPAPLQGSLSDQLRWQRFDFPKAYETSACNIVLNTDAGTISRIRPSVTMSRDMLSFEPGIMSLYGISRERVRLLILKYVQAHSLRSADGAIFLTEYAAKVIQRYSGPLKRIQIIPHGVGRTFLKTETQNRWKRNDPSLPFRCVYVSNTDLYKNQWNVALAIHELRMRGYDCKLQLIGGGDGQGQELLDSVLRRVDPAGEHIEQLPFLPQDSLPDILGRSDIAVFASSCENMPNTLLEAMAMGLPIVSSNKGPMPEVLGDAGLYCNPLDPQSIADGIERIIVNPQLAESLSKAARARASVYSWARCAEQTWQFLSNTYRQVSSTT